MTGKYTLLGLTLFLAGAIGCDPSKPELEKTKGELATVTAERDGLKTQLEAANGKVGMLTQQVTDLTAKAAAAAAAPAPAAEEPADAKGKKPAAKKPAAAKAAPEPTPEVKKELEAAPAAKKGRGHF